jgi:uncharacterized protein (PEP-CTERM system associated)
MKRQEDHGRAIGKQQLKTSGAPYHHPLRAMQHESYFCFSADGSPLEDPAIGREAARPSGQPGCSSYFIINTGPITISRQYAIRLSFSAICFIATEMLFLSQHVCAAEWSIMPSLNLKETYSDNIRLAPPGSEMSNWVTEINPGISLTGTGSNLKVSANYQMQNIFYAKDRNSNRTNHSLSADANAQLVDNLLFLDGNAGISQQNIFLFGPQPPDNTNITGNRASVANYSISPYLRHSFDAIASTELRYTHDEVRTRVSGFSNSRGDSALFNLISGSAFSRLGWGLHYNKQKTGYSNNPTVNTETFSGDLRFPITPKFSLSATKGYEKYNYLSISVEPPEGHFWTAGFSWTPTARTSFDASTGKRFFGNTHSLAASHHSRNTVWNINYSEDITTSRSQFLIPATINTADFLDQLWTPSIPDPVLRKQFIDSFILSNGLPTSLSENINYLTNGYFLQKRLQASVALNSTKSTLILNAFDTLRQARTAQSMDSLLFGTSNLTLNDDTEQIGGNVMWNWRYSPRTNINVSSGYTKSHSISTSRTEKFWLMGLGMTRQFRPKLNGSVDLRRNQNHSDQIGGGYQENAITASLLIQF